MICRLCLSNTDDFFGLFDSYGLSVSAVDIVSQHFWFEPKINDSKSGFICRICWDIVKNFHDLYETVERAHKCLGENLLSIKSDPDEEEFLNQNKDNEFDWDNIVFDKIDLKAENIEGIIINTTEDLLTSCISDEDKILHENVKPITIQKEEILHINNEKIKLRKRGSRCKINESNLNSNQKNKLLLQKDPLNNIPNNDNNNLEVSNIKIDSKSPSNSKLAQEDQRIATFMKMICVICHTECPNFSSLRWHFITKHKQKGFAICCDKKFYKRSVLVDHVEKHINPDSFKCNLCNKVCISRWTLKLHNCRVHENTEAGHQCSYCGKSFKLKTILMRHQLIHMPEEEKKYKCEECGKRYPSQGTLSSHIRAYHDRRYAGMCDICGKTYNNKEDVRRHRLEVHEGVARENIKCKLCTKEFTTKYQYNIHKVEEHGDPNQKREHRCKHCDKVSANSEALKRHVQKVHKAKLKFFCSFCEKVFKTDLSLKEHQTTHTGEPLYICPHCPRTFTHNSNMHHHRKRAHPVEFEEARQRKNEKKESWMQITAFQN